MTQKSPNLGLVTDAMLHIAREDDRVQESSCLNCGGPVYGRTDRKYCSVECKNRYNYVRRSSMLRIKNRTLSSIAKNYLILSGMLEKGLKSAYVADLIEEGFKPGCVTGVRKDRHHSLELRCYDISYLLSDTRVYQIRYCDTF